MKTWICTAIGAVGATVASFFGGWDAGQIMRIYHNFIDIFPNSNYNLIKIKAVTADE